LQQLAADWSHSEWDFTPLCKAEVEFSALILPDGSSIPTSTLVSVALISNLL